MKRMEQSFLRTEKNETYRMEKNAVPNPDKNVNLKKVANIFFRSFTI